ncbi:hypothetical protein CRENBAI_008421 [Crenichthys baileyi]|uniref:Uncharacterized protein n=1 Tax=Crenichthys baileyi TaxID=28760 RepID=A0AAV9RF20_9TELE
MPSTRHRHASTPRPSVRPLRAPSVRPTHPIRDTHSICPWEPPPRECLSAQPARSSVHLLATLPHHLLSDHPYPSSPCHLTTQGVYPVSVPYLSSVSPHAPPESSPLVLSVAAVFSYLHTPCLPLVLSLVLTLHTVPHTARPRELAVDTPRHPCPGPLSSFVFSFVFLRSLSPCFCPVFTRAPPASIEALSRHTHFGDIPWTSPTECVVVPAYISTIVPPMTLRSVPFYHSTYVLSL